MTDSDDFAKYGDARFADGVDLRRGGFYTEGGVYLGRDNIRGRPIYWNGEGHLLTVAPAGFGKTTKLIIPNLLTYDQGSVVVTDPKGSLTAITSRYRREALGNRIVVLNPWREEIADEEAGLGVDLGDTGYNPLRTIKPRTPSVIDNAETLCNLICPTPPNARESFFTKTGAQILTGVVLYLAHAEGVVTLPRLFECIRTNRDGWRKIAKDMLTTEGIDLDPYAGEILSNLESERQWSGVVGAMHEATQIYNPQKPLGAHVERDEFNPDDLKREPTTVYVVVPSNRRVANMAWLSLVMASIAEAVGKPSRSAPVLLVAEEFANLGYMPTIASAMAEYREAGLKVHLIIQNLMQLSNRYGHDGAQDLINNCNVKQYFAVNDAQLAKSIQDHVGTYTAQERTEPKIGLFGGGSPDGRLVGRHQMHLTPAQDILNMAPDEQLILTTGETPVIYGALRGYYDDKTLRPRADPNPYRRGMPEPVPSPLERLQTATTDALSAIGGHVWGWLPSGVQSALEGVGRGVTGAQEYATRLPWAWGRFVSPLLQMAIVFGIIGAWFLAYYGLFSTKDARETFLGVTFVVIFGAWFLVPRGRGKTFAKQDTIRKKP